VDDDEEGDTGSLLPNVRLVNGKTRDATRRTLMLAFNTPFFPEVLIASAVMAEGVDLHLACRHVIHHDLDWNPSVLEQRTGRLDRIGGKSEVVGRPIHVYEPFVEATQDEKLYRVVKDRERWFNVIMGEGMTIDEAATDRAANRAALPAALNDSLAMNLGLNLKS
jgi:superfamily II DNA/RNA helicase